MSVSDKVLDVASPSTSPKKQTLANHVVALTPDRASFNVRDKRYPVQALAQQPRSFPMGSLSRAARMITLSIKTFPIDRRKVLTISLAALSIAAIPTTLSASKRPPRVLFICQFGTAKSAIARELFKRRAAQRGIAVAVFSRGITPAPHLAASTRDQLTGEGINLNGEAVRRLRSTDLRAADIVVAFDPLPATMHPTAVRDWAAVPSVNETYTLARADLDRRIDLLLDQLAQPRR